MQLAALWPVNPLAALDCGAGLALRLTRARHEPIKGAKGGSYRMPSKLAFWPCTLPRNTRRSPSVSFSLKRLSCFSLAMNAFASRRPAVALKKAVSRAQPG